jgi:CheY-like chemotaxis protein
MLKRSFGAIKPIAEHRYAPDEELCRIIERMMKIDLKARYQTMDDVVTDLERYVASVEAIKSGAPTAAQTEDDDNVFMDAVLAQPEARHEPAGMTEAPARPEPKPVPSKSILCVEAQTEIKDAFRKTLSNMGYRVILVSDAEVGAERFRESPLDAVIFDTDGQDSESIEAFLDMHETAHEEGHQLNALVLLGHKQAALKEKLPTDDRLIVLMKPVKMKQIQDAILQLVPLS